MKRCGRKWGVVADISLLLVVLLLAPELYGPLQSAVASSSGEKAVVADSYAEKWTFSELTPADTPQVGPDGNIYFYLSNGTFCALNPDGKIQWTYNVNRTPYAYAFSPTGGVYVFSDALYSLNPDGSLKWSLAIENPEKKTPTMLVSQNGVLYLVLYDIYAISSEGRIEWTYEASKGGPFYPGVLASNSVIAGSDTNNTVVAVDFEGNRLWSREISRSVADVFFSDEGVVLVENYGNQLYAFSISGTPLWNRSFPEGVRIAPDGQIYAFENSLPPRYHVLNPLNGEEMWSFSANYVEFSGNSTILASTDEGLTIYSLNSAGQVQWQYSKSFDYLWASSLTVSSSGVIFFAVYLSQSLNCFIYAIVPGAKEPKLIAMPPLAAVTADPLIGSDGQDTIYFWSGTITAYEADSDSDGVPDSKDFLPTINNGQFWWGIVLAILVVLILLSMKFRPKKEEETGPYMQKRTM